MVGGLGAKGLWLLAGCGDFFFFLVGGLVEGFACCFFGGGGDFSYWVWVGCW